MKITMNTEVWNNTPWYGKLCFKLGWIFIDIAMKSAGLNDTK